MDEDIEGIASVLQTLVYSTNRGLSAALKRLLRDTHQPRCTMQMIASFRQTAAETRDVTGALTTIFGNVKFDDENIVQLLTLEPSEYLPSVISCVYSQALVFIIGVGEEVNFAALDSVLTNIFPLISVDLKRTVFLHAFIIERVLSCWVVPFPHETILTICSHVCFPDNVLTKNLYVFLGLLGRAENWDSVKAPAMMAIQKMVFGIRRQDGVIEPRKVVEAIGGRDILISNRTICILGFFASLEFHEEYLLVVLNIASCLMNMCRGLEMSLTTRDYEQGEDDVDKKLDKWLGVEVAERVRLIARMLSGTLGARYIVAFFEVVCATERSLYVTVLLAYTVLNVKRRLDSPLGFADHMYREDLFNHEVTVFTHGREAEDIFVLRQMVVSALVSHCYRTADDFFAKLIGRPLLFADVLFRGCGNSGMMIISDTFFRIFVDEEMRLRSMCDGEPHGHVKVAMSYNLKSFVELFSHVSIRESILQPEIIAKDTMTMVSAECFHGPLIEAIGELLRYDVPITAQTCQGVLIIENIATIISYVHDDDVASAVTLVCEMLEMILKVLTTNESIHRSVGSLVMTASNAAKRLNSRGIVLSILRLAECLTQDVDSSVFGGCGTLLAETEVSYDSDLLRLLFNILLKPIDGHEANTCPFKEAGNRCIIAKCNILPLIFAYCARFSKMEDLFRTIDDLCDVTTLNRIALHDGEFDLCLIDFLTEAPVVFRGIYICASETLDFAIAASILLKIFSVKSSQLVAQRLMKFVTRSPNCEALLPHILPLKDKLLSHARTYWPVARRELVFNSEAFEIRKLQAGWTIVMKCFVDEVAATRHNDVTVICRVAPLFRLVMKGTDLFCRADLLDDGHELLMGKLSGNQWNSLIINLVHSQLNVTHCTTYLNERLISTVQITGTGAEEGEFAFFIAGNACESGDDSVNVMAAYHIAVLGFYKFPFDQADRKMFADAPFNDQGVNGSPGFMLSGTKSSTYDDRAHPLRSVYDVLQKDFPVEAILPAFEDLGKLANVLGFLGFLKSVFGSRLISVLGQISLLLPKNVPALLTADLYLAFYDWMGIMFHDPTLFDVILINFNIWMRATAENVMKIVDHWMCVLAPEHMVLFQRPGMLMSMIIDVRRYLYINKEKEAIACDFARDPELDVFSTVTCVFSVAIAVNETMVTVLDVEMFMECIMSCADLEYVEFVLMRLSSDLEIIKARGRTLALLRCLDITRFPKGLLQLMYTLYIASRDGFYRESLVLSDRLSRDTYTDQFVANLLQFPELFAVCLILGVSSSNEHKLEIMTVLHGFVGIPAVIEQITKCNGWIVWPILFALQSSEDIQQMMVSFITVVATGRCVIETTNQALSLLDIISVTTKIETNRFKFALVSELLCAGVRDRLDGLRIWLIETCFRVLYLRCGSSSVSPGMAKAWNESVFCAGIALHRRLTVSGILSNQALKLIVTGMKLTDVNYVFVLPKKSAHLQRETVTFSDLIETSFRGQKGIFKSLHTAMINANTFQRRKWDNSEMVRYLNDLLDAGWSPYVVNVRTTTIAFVRKLRKWFRQQDDLINECRLIELKHTDPGVSIMKDREIATGQATASWMGTLQKFVHERQLFDRDWFVWKRDNRFTLNYTSAMLKRALRDKVHRSNDGGTFNKSYRVFFPCMRIRIESTDKYSYYLLAEEIVLVSASKTKHIEFSDLYRVLCRNRNQKTTALEFFLRNGTSTLLDFAPISADKVLSSLRASSQIAHVSFTTSDYAGSISYCSLVEKWCTCEITNYDFIVHLNMLTGRSMQDPDNYLVFPWVTVEDGQQRDLGLPIAAQSAHRLSQYRKEIQDGNSDSFIFGTAPSNAMLLSFYFVRLEPFTSLHLRIHDGKFDCPNRMFNDFNAFMANMESGKECKESCQEFYAFPEMFMGLSRLGAVANITLPDNKNVFDFIYANRKNLGSNYVSKHLHEWIDLIFGVCQRGSKSVERCNVFMGQLQSTVWSEPQFANQPDVIASLLKSLGSLPPVVFDSHIHGRYARKQPWIGSSQLWHRCVGIWRATIVAKDGEVNMCAFLEKGAVTRVNGEENRVRMRSVPGVVACANSSAIFYGDLIVLVDGSTRRVSLVLDDCSIVKLDAVIARPDFIAVGSRVMKCLYIVTREGLVERLLLTKEAEPTKLLQVFSDSLTAVVISHDFGVFSCGTSDNYLEVHALEKGRFIKSHYLGETIRFLLVTPCIGLIVSKTDTHIWLFTVNGFFIKKVACSLMLNMWIAFKDDAGLDMVCCADVDGRVFIFEAYFPETMKLIASLGFCVLSLSYDSVTGALAAVTSEHIHTIAP